MYFRINFLLHSFQVILHCSTSNIFASLWRNTQKSPHRNLAIQKLDVKQESDAELPILCGLKLGHVGSRFFISTSLNSDRHEKSLRLISLCWLHVRANFFRVNGDWSANCGDWLKKFLSILSTRAPMQNVIYYWSGTGLMRAKSGWETCENRIANDNNKNWFLSAFPTAVDLIHINVLLSLIPYLPIPTNLITISLILGSSTMAHRTSTHSRFIGYCALNGACTLLLLLQISVIVLNCNKLNMVVEQTL